MEMNLREAYSERFPLLEEAALNIENLINDILGDVPRIDRVSSRVKPLDRFLEKAARTDPFGELRYDNPLPDIQDQIGVCIVVLYKSDLAPVAERVLAEFRQVEDRVIEQPDPEAFSYEARHLVCLIPPDIQARYKPPIDFFELQIITLFQHAWAEANHDLGYKSPRDLSYSDRRRIAWAAAQAWGADQIFDEMWNRLRID